MDLTDMIVAVIGAVATALGTYFVKRYLIPWLEEKKLMDVACIVVDSVEALFGRYNGLVKWEEAIARMQQRGFNVDSGEVIDALMAAWQDLDLRQHAAGVKDPEWVEDKNELDEKENPGSVENIP